MSPIEKDPTPQHLPDVHEAPPASVEEHERGPENSTESDARSLEDRAQSFFDSLNLDEMTFEQFVDALVAEPKEVSSWILHNKWKEFWTFLKKHKSTISTKNTEPGPTQDNPAEKIEDILDIFAARGSDDEASSVSHEDTDNPEDFQLGPTEGNPAEGREDTFAARTNEDSAHEGDQDVPAETESGVDTAPREDDVPDLLNDIENDSREKTPASPEPEKDGKTDSDPTPEDRKLWEQGLEKSMGARIFGGSVRDWLVGLGAGATVGVAVRAVAPWSIVGGAAGGGLAALTSASVREWAQNTFRQQDKYLSRLEKKYKLDRNADAFWEKARDVSHHLERELIEKKKEVDDKKNELREAHDKKEKKKIEKEYRQRKKEIEALGDRVRYIYAEMGAKDPNDSEHSGKAIAQKVEVFTNALWERGIEEMEKDSSIEIKADAEAELKQWLWEGLDAQKVAFQSGSELYEKEKTRRRGMSKRLAAATVRGAAIGTVAGTIGGWLSVSGGDVDIALSDTETPSNASSSVEYAQNTSPDTPANASSSLEYAQNTSPDTPANASSSLEYADKASSETPTNASSSLEYATKSPLDDIDVSQKLDVAFGADDVDRVMENFEPIVGAAEHGTETSLPEQFTGNTTLDAGDNVWRVVQDRLQEALGRTPTHAEILDVSKAVAADSDIAVPEWGVDGSADHTTLPEGYTLVFGDNTHAILEDMHSEGMFEAGNSESPSPETPSNASSSVEYAQNTASDAPTNAFSSLDYVPESEPVTPDTPDTGETIIATDTSLPDSEAVQAFARATAERAVEGIPLSPDVMDAFVNTSLEPYAETAFFAQLDFRDPALANVLKETSLEVILNWSEPATESVSTVYDHVDELSGAHNEALRDLATYIKEDITFHGPEVDILTNNDASLWEYLTFKYLLSRAAEGTTLTT